MAGRYALAGALGKSDLGWRYAADVASSELGATERVAVLVLRSEHAMLTAPVRSSVQRELALLRRVHAAETARNVVRPVEPHLISQDDVVAVVLEHIDGPLLEEIIAREPLATEEARRLGAGIARGLAHIHLAGGTLGRFGARSVRLRDGDEPVIVHLGRAKAVARGESQEELGQAADVHALGLLLERMFSAERDAPGSYREDAHARPRARALGSKPAIPARLGAIVASCLQSEAGRRPLADNVASELERLAPNRVRARRTFAAIGATASIGVCLLALAAWAKTAATTAVALTGSSAPLSVTSTVTAGASVSATARPPRSPEPSRLLAKYPPTRVGKWTGVKAIGAGWMVAALVGDSVWIWETPQSGQLWDDRPPYELDTVHDAKALAVGGPFNVVLTSDGGVVAFTNSTPVRIKGLSGVKAVAAGRPALVLRHNGTVATLELPDPGATLRADVPYPLHLLVAKPVPDLSKVMAISEDWGVPLALRTDGSVWFWGDVRTTNGRGRRGVPPTRVSGLPRIAAIKGSLALDADGRVWGWEYNTSVPTTRADAARFAVPKPVTAIAAAGANSLALDQEGGVWSWHRGLIPRNFESGIPMNETPTRVEGLPPAKAIATNSDYAVAIARDGTLWAWGAVTEARRR